MIFLTPPPVFSFPSTSLIGRLLEGHLDQGFESERSHCIIARGRLQQQLLQQQQLSIFLNTAQQRVG